MNYKKQLEEAISKLKSKGTTFGGNKVKINDPISEDSIEVINMLVKDSPTLEGDLFNFYKQIDGASFHWSLPSESTEGGLIINTAIETALRGGATEDSEPLEGVLFSGEEDENILKQFKQMYIFDSVPGRSDFITFIPDGDKLKLYLVEDSEITELKTNLIQTIDMLTKYAGCWGLRHHLTHDDWQERIKKDKLLKNIFD